MPFGMIKKILAMIVRQVTLLCLASSFHLDSKPQKVTYLNESKNSRKKRRLTLLISSALKRNSCPYHWTWLGFFFFFVQHLIIEFKPLQSFSSISFFLSKHRILLKTMRIVVVEKKFIHVVSFPSFSVLSLVQVQAHPRSLG